MATILKQSTQIKVRVGPFVDATDGVTPETGIALGTADEAEILKADGAATADISGATWAAITGADGWYDLTLTTSHTDTVGELVVVVQDASECLPVFARFQVVEETIYDALMAASAAGFDSNGRVDVGSWLGTAVTLSATTAKPEVDVNSVSDDATAANNLESACDNYSAERGLTGTALPAAAADAAGGVPVSDAGALDLDALDAQINDIETDTQDIQNRIPAALSSGNIKADVLAISTSTAAADNLEASAETIIEAITDETSFSSTTTQFESDTAGLSSTDDFYNGRAAIFTSGTDQNQATKITDYDGTNKRFTVTALTNAPGDDATFVIV